jgi:hypothetical protein
MLVRRHSPIFVIQGLLVVGLLGGCIVEAGSGGHGGVGSAGVGSSGVGGSGVGGEPYTAGVGGDYSGVGGADTTSTGTGGASCVGESGSGSVLDCDEMNIAPAQGAASICGPSKNEPPIGYAVCNRGFTIFTIGAATYLQQCLSLIGVQDECELSPVQNCIDDTFAVACDDQRIALTCQDISSQCGGGFDTARCTSDLRAFSDSGLTELESCISVIDPTLTCQQAFDACYEQVLTF